jgi:hypothetical protein
VPPEADPARLSRILSRAATEANREVSFVAFKALPVDISSPYVHMGVDAAESEQFKVTDCRQAVDFILRCIMRTAHERRANNPLLVEYKEVVRCVRPLSLLDEAHLLRQLGRGPTERVTLCQNGIWDQETTMVR